MYLHGKAMRANDICSDSAKRANRQGGMDCVWT